MIPLPVRSGFLVAVAVVLSGAPLFAQEVRIAGTVRDATGATLPAATVTVTNQSTGATQVVTSSTDGTFSASVPPGTYTVAVSLRGFGRQTREVQVGPGAPEPLAFSLEPQLQEEVTVTAMLREQTVTDVPFSIAAPTEEDLHRRGADDIEDVAANVAGFTVQNLGPGQSQVAIRGVSAGQVVRDQPGVKEQVGAYLDDSIVSLSLFTPDLDLFDVSRVEVLRGPQGTLFGAGSLSGTVRYITNQPEIGATRWFGEVGGSAVQGGSLGGSAKLGFNLPLGSQAALRVAAYYSRLAGYIDAVQPDLSVEEDVNTGDRTGVRAAVRIAPSERLSITPRLVYQRVETDGWNRVDAFNILGNPFTTTRPAVMLGERQQFTQFEEPFTDDFLLADVNLRYGFGDVLLTSITSYTHRDVLVVRDATALTASITGGSIGLPPSIYTIDAPLDDATEATVWTQELRLSGGRDRFRWVAGGFYSRNERDYGQDLLVSGFEAASGIPTQGLRAPRDVLFFSDLSYELQQFALFGEGTWSVSDRLDLTGGLRYYDFSEDREQVFDGIFGNDNNGTSLVSTPGSTNASGFAPRLIASYRASDRTNLNAQVSRGFRLGGINDPLNVPLCTPADLVTFSGRDTWEDETAWNYEVGAKSRVMDGRGRFNVALFDMEIRDLQATVTAGSCSSRVVFNVPKARSRGAEVEFAAAPNPNFDFSISASYIDSKLRSTLTSTSAAGGVSVVSGIEEGARLPTVPELQVAASASYQWQLGQGSLGYLTGTYQHVGSRFTQIGDQASGFGTVNLLAFAPNTIGGPLGASTFTFDPELPAYDIVNLRLGVLRGRWDLSVYGHNLTDERALLALDQERGTLARVGFLTNQPRTFGFTARFNY
ncbi:MAG TPA: TonB-dependent receptor [Vicinamibacteria bacterium]|nr:TonB-dependent receptor [Vicinamibacteria bacterium]